MSTESASIFFQDCEDNDAGSSGASSGSFESISFPSPTDFPSDCSSTSAKSMSIESLAWNKSILDLFEGFVGSDVISTTAAPADGPVCTVTRPCVPECAQQASHADLKTLSNRSLSDQSTFCFEETMMEYDTMADENDELQVCDRLGSEDLMDHVVDDTVAKEYISSPNEHSTPIAGEDKASRNENTIAGEKENSGPALDEWNVDHHNLSPIDDDDMRDSGFCSSFHDALDSTTTNEVTSERHKQIQDKISDLLQQIDRSVNEGIPLPVRRKPTWQTCTMENGILQSNSHSQEEKIIVRPINCRRLQLMVRLLASIYQLLVTGTSCTKRELYYIHLELAQSPSYTYAVLDDVCALLGVDTWEVNVFNTSKGLIAGPLVLTLACGRTIDCNLRWGMSVPLDVGSVVELTISAKVVLVVEKDTVFKRLLEDGILDKFQNRLLLVTGKGYPDVSTRLLLKKIADWTNVPICGLMDADPHGIEILCVYKFGSLTMAYQQQSLAVPSMRWIGLFPSDIELLGLYGVPLRDTELKKIEHMAKRPYTAGIVQRELLFLRQLATKAEIESLYHIASDFVTTVYLVQKLTAFTGRNL